MPAKKGACENQKSACQREKGAREKKDLWKLKICKQKTKNILTNNLVVPANNIIT